MTLHNIVWIASYPKSGNTWIRFFLFNLLLGKQDSCSQLDELIPDIHGTPNLILSSKGILVKTHFKFSPSMPYFENSLGFMYIVRHPADVMMSNFSYALRRANVVDKNAYENLKASYIDQFITCKGDPLWIKFFGSWIEHISSWLDQETSIPRLFIKYEDMKEKPLVLAGQINDFLKLNKKKKELEDAIDNSSFNRMRSVEESDIQQKKIGIFYKPDFQQSIDSGIRFMRRGSLGEGMQSLSDIQREKFFLAFGPVLEKLGYDCV